MLLQVIKLISKLLEWVILENTWNTDFHEAIVLKKVNCLNDQCQKLLIFYKFTKQKSIVLKG